MLRTDVRIQTNRDAAGAVEGGTRKALLNAGQAGLNRSLQEVPHGATEGLAESAFGPDFDRDGSLVWGFGAKYARAVQEGTRPHWPPIEPLKRWARRVTDKGESFAYYVQWKIGQEGTEGQDFIGPGIEATKAHLRSKGLKVYVQEEL